LTSPTVLCLGGAAVVYS